MGNGAKPHLTALQNADEQRRASRDELLTPRIREREVFVRSLGRTVMLRSLPYGERRKLQVEAGFQTEKYDDDKMTMLGIVASVLDPRLTKKDVTRLREQDAAIIDELSIHIASMNVPGAVAEGKDSSAPTPSSDSASS